MKDLKLDILKYCYKSEPYEMKNKMKFSENEFVKIIKPINYNKLFAKIINDILPIKQHELFIGEYSIIIKPKKLNKNYIVITAHFDSVYNTPFLNLKKGKLFGTMDNIIGVYSVINLINIFKNSNDIIFTFTDCEETTREGIKNVVYYINQYIKVDPQYYLVIDVTDEETKRIATIENCNIVNLIYDENKIEKIDNVKCGYDEAKYLNDLNINSLSICAAVKSPLIGCHSEEGSKIKDKNLDEYIKIIEKFVKQNRSKYEKCKCN